LSALPPSRPTVLVLGDINIDILARIAKFPQPGGDCLAPALEMHLGGVAANTAVALTRWGVRARLVGCVGSDWFGDLALDLLRRAHVEASRIERTTRATTGLMFIAVSTDGERTIFGSRGANAEMTRGRISGHFAGTRAAHLLGYNFLSPSVAAAAGRVLRETRKRGGLVTLDVGMAPSQNIPQKILQVARKVDILFVGPDEAAALVGERNRLRAFHALRARGAREVVMKLGEQGCLFRENDALRQAPPFAVKAVDTTGAGDAFAAAYLWARLRGWPGSQAALLANAAGATAVRTAGASDAMPAPQQVLRLLRANRLSRDWDSVRASAVKRLSAEYSRDFRGRPQ
jgi:ribokinase